MSNTPTDTPQDTDPSDDRDQTADHDTVNTGVIQWVSALAALAALVGLWIIASPFVYEATDTAYWNNTLVGTGIFVLAGYNFVRLSRDRLASTGVASLAALLGVWIAVSPYLLEMGTTELATSTIVSGVIVAALCAYNAYANTKADTTAHTPART